MTLNSIRYRILTIGKAHKSWIKSGIKLYLKRMPKLTIIELRNSNLKQEAKLIKNALKADEILVALTEEGDLMSSTTFSQHLQEIDHQRLAFVIGGPDGLDPEIKSLARWKLSLSRMTFPHEIARLLLIEQIYRAQTIAEGSPYHRN